VSPKPQTLPKPGPGPVVAGPRLSLESIGDTRKATADRILLIGVEGIGKSTFAANAPNSVFIGAEEGLSEIDAKAFPEVNTFEDVLAAIDVLTNSEHTYKTLALDTIDWIEPLIWDYLCRKNGWGTIEDPGYGKGYVAALDQWRVMLRRLETLWQRGMEIILLAHAGIIPFQNPAGPDYSRYEPKVHRKAASLLKEWAKTVLFAIYEEYAADTQDGKPVGGVATKKKVKGVATGARIMHTQRTAAWDAKNRFGLPPTLPLDYTEYVAAREAGLQVDPAQIVAECLALAEKLNLTASSKPLQFVETNKTNPGQLLRALNRLRTQVAEAGL
jgi:hypothetical protein